MSDSNLKSAVLQHLPKGKPNAITGKDLAEALNQRDTRKMRLAIEELIDDGVAVCSSPHKPYGYFIASCPEEVEEALAILKRGYGKMLFHHYKYLRIAGQKAFPQQIDVPKGQLSLSI